MLESASALFTAGEGRECSGPIRREGSAWVRVITAQGYAPAYGPDYYDGDAYAYGAPPVCTYGYYPYTPYSCAPYGYWGPDYFFDGAFIGAGPWFGFGFRGPRWDAFVHTHGFDRGGFRGGFGGRGFDGGRGFSGNRGFQGGGRGFAAPGWRTRFRGSWRRMHRSPWRRTRLRGSWRRTRL